MTYVGGSFIYLLLNTNAFSHSERCSLNLTYYCVAEPLSATHSLPLSGMGKRIGKLRLRKLKG